MKRLLVFAALFVLPVQAAVSQGKSTSHGAVSATVTKHGSGSTFRPDPRNPPPLAADRKVHVQDCTKPIDWSADNLKCR